MLRQLFNLSFWLLTLTYTTTALAFTVPNDEDYFIFNDGYYEYIYTAKDRPYIHYLIKYNRVFRGIYEKEFNWQFDEKPRLIIPSGRNQVSNGFATVMPSLFTVFYTGGADMIDYFSSPSWAFTLLSHETSHLYQLNVKRGYSTFLKKVVGNPSPNFFPPFTYTIYPNAFLPTFILEGNATMNEGRFGAGGRLYSGQSRALLLQMVKAGKLTSKRLMNDHLDFPYGHEKYLIGGFFNQHLTDKFGAEKVNRYFFEHANHMFNPFRVNTPFVNTFGVGYEDVLKEMNSKWGELAQSQNTAAVEPFAETQFHTPMTRAGRDVLLLGTNAKYHPRLYRVNPDGQVDDEWVNLPLGRIFETTDNELVAASAEVISNDQIKFGLFEEGYGLVDGTTDRVYYDLQGEKSLYARADKSFLETQLYMGKQKLGVTHSSAILGRDGQPYFFRQVDKKRTLYRGDTPLYSYQGYYGFPVDADKEGRVYFIGPVEKGSSLFRVNVDGRVVRVLESDAVVDAKILFKENRAVAVEVGSDSYLFKILPLTEGQDEPFEYKYAFEAKKEFTVYKPPMIEVTEAVKLENEKSFSHLGNIHYTGFDPFIFVGGDGYPIASANFNFSDPFMKHNFSLGLGRGAFDSFAAAMTYLNRQYEVNVLLGVLFNRYVDVEFNEATDEYDVEERYDSWIGMAGLIWPYFQRPQWVASLSSTYFYTFENSSETDREEENRNTVLSQAQFQRVNSAPLGFYSHQNFALELAHEYINNNPGSDKNRERIVYGAEIEASQDVLHETYLGVGYQAAKTDSIDPELEIKRLEILSTLAATRFTRVSTVTGLADLEFFELRKFSADFRQAVNLSVYFTKIPLALRRFSLIGFYNEFYGSLVRGEDPETLFHEYGYGTEIEFLLLHTFPFRILFLGSEASVEDSTEVSAIIGGNWRF